MPCALAVGTPCPAWLPLNNPPFLGRTLTWGLSQVDVVALLRVGGRVVNADLRPGGRGGAAGGVRVKRVMLGRLAAGPLLHHGFTCRPYLVDHCNLVPGVFQQEGPAWGVSRQSHHSCTAKTEEGGAGSAKRDAASALFFPLLSPLAPRTRQSPAPTPQMRCTGRGGRSRRRSPSCRLGT